VTASAVERGMTKHKIQFGTHLFVLVCPRLPFESPTFRSFRSFARSTITYLVRSEYTTVADVDIAELEMGDVAEIKFPSPNDLTKFEVIVTPDSGYWKGATYRFTFNIPAGYPHDPPKVMCATKIYHPNINLQGNVCLNILREEWKPVLQIEHVIHGVLFLFYEPNPGDPLNQEAAEELRNHKARFERSVRESLRGGYVHGEQFPRLI